MNDEKITQALRFLGLGYMLFYCFAFIPYFGVLIGFTTENMPLIMMLPMVVWWIFLFIFIFSRDLGFIAKYINKENAMKYSYKIGIIFCIINIIGQLLTMVLSNKYTFLPLILSITADGKLGLIPAIIALLAGSMTLAPLYMSRFINADTEYYVKHTYTTYSNGAYEKTTSNKFIKTGQFVAMSLLVSLLSIIVSATPAIIIVLIILLIKNKKYKNI